MKLKYMLFSIKLWVQEKNEEKRKSPLTQAIMIAMRQIWWLLKLVCRNLGRSRMLACSQRSVPWCILLDTKWDGGLHPGMGRVEKWWSCNKFCYLLNILYQSESSSFIIVLRLCKMLTWWQEDKWEQCESFILCLQHH